MDVLLSLDLSTKSTGWAKFDLNSKKLLGYGLIQPRVLNPRKKGVPKYKYPEFQLLKIRDICAQVCIELLDENVKVIVIEEVNRGISRLPQKTLDGLHFVLMDHIREEFIDKVIYVDSDGKEGWRSARGLKLQLSEQDKLINAERRKTNKKIREHNKKVRKKDDKKQLLHIITQKDLACRFVNKIYNTEFDVEKRESDSDQADAIGLGHFYLNY